MAYLTWQRLTLVGLCSVALAWLVTMVMDRGGATPTAVPWTVYGICAAAGALALVFGWQVRKFQLGDRPGLDGLRAARTAVYAQACAYAGAILAGAFGGYALGLVDQWSHGPRRDVIISALLGALAGVALVIAGAVAERWCRYNGNDNERGDGTPTEPSPA